MIKKNDCTAFKNCNYDPEEVQTLSFNSRDKNTTLNIEKLKLFLNIIPCCQELKYIIGQINIKMDPVIDCLCRVYPVFHPVTAGIGSSTLVTLN